MPTATLTSKGQVTIPKKIRETLDLHPGDILNFEIDKGDKISITPDRKPPEEAYGILYREEQEALTVEEMDKGVAEYFRKKYKPE